MEVRTIFIFLVRSNKMRQFSKCLTRKVMYPAKLAKFDHVRFFSDDLGIPTDKEQQTGRRRAEIEAEEHGEVGFNDQPIIPEPSAGTKTRPILVNMFC